MRAAATRRLVRPAWDDASVSATAEDEVDQLRRELRRLRAENERLARLLEIQGQDTAPAPEQPVAGLAPSGVVTMDSPAADKLALYADLFSARTDVYAVRWENGRTGTSGWMPAVPGGWRKGMDRRSVTHLPLTSQVIAAHLVGEVFAGLYPLLRDNSCRFLVADFDGSAAMLDALAYTKAARANDVPTALEVSQSGGGAHVWAFFTDRVPASTAREIGTTTRSSGSARSSGWASRQRRSGGTGSANSSPGNSVPSGTR
jgi:hypothetical protein